MSINASNTIFASSGNNIIIELARVPHFPEIFALLFVIFDSTYNGMVVYDLGTLIQDEKRQSVYKFINCPISQYTIPSTDLSYVTRMTYDINDMLDETDMLFDILKFKADFQKKAYAKKKIWQFA